MHPSGYKEEYILKTASNEDWQKWLNQWRHNYTIEILSMVHCSHSDNNHVTILIKRTPKEKPNV